MKFWNFIDFLFRMIVWIIFIDVIALIALIFVSVFFYEEVVLALTFFTTLFIK